MKAEELARRMCCCRTTEEKFGAPEPHGCTLALPYAEALIEAREALRLVSNLHAKHKHGGCLTCADGAYATKFPCETRQVASAALAKLDALLEVPRG